MRATQRGRVLYVEGSTDFDSLSALAQHRKHGVADQWDGRINSDYVQNNFPDRSLDAEVGRVEGGFGLKPKEHFFAIRAMVPELVGIAILDKDDRARHDFHDGGLPIAHWRRYECENYFVTPDTLSEYAKEMYSDLPLFTSINRDISEVLDRLILERVFGGRSRDFEIWQGLDSDAALLLWESRTSAIKLSDFAEEFFRRLAVRTGRAMLLRKGELHRLVRFTDSKALSEEVSEKLDMLSNLFASAPPDEE